MSHNATPTPFGAYIRECRLRAGKSMREVGAALDIAGDGGVSGEYVRQVESGARGPFKSERWPALAVAIGADPSELARLALPEVDRLREENARLRGIVGEIASRVACAVV